MTDDIGCKSIMFRGGATGRVVTCGVCDWCRARRVTELEAQVEQATARAARAEAAAIQLRDALVACVEPEDGDYCYFDHDGNCQQHWGESPCSVGVALELLASPDVQAIVSADRAEATAIRLRDALEELAEWAGGWLAPDENWPNPIDLLDSPAVQALPDTTEGGES